MAYIIQPKTNGQIWNYICLIVASGLSFYLS